MGRKSALNALQETDMNAQHIAALALENWRASGTRTESRRDSLVISYAEAYWGNSAKWQPAIREEVERAHLITRQRTRIDELKYT